MKKLLLGAIGLISMTILALLTMLLQNTVDDIDHSGLQRHKQTMVSSDRSSDKPELDNFILGSRYDGVRRDFLAIDEDYFFTWTLNTVKDKPEQNVLGHPGSKRIPNTFGFKVAGRGSKSKWRNFGANHWCDNEFGEMSVCRFSTGGMIANKPDTLCGSEVSPYYEVAKTQGDLFCKKKPAQWREFVVWMGAYKNHDYIKDFFPGARMSPLNRLCAEIEFPHSNFELNVEALVKNPEYGMLVNPEVAAKYLQHVLFEYGTYTSPYYTSKMTTKDEERGGTYHRGGSHFYHKPSRINRRGVVQYFAPNKAYALSQHTMLMCINDAPSGVRNGMRPAYFLNPLMTVVGDNEEGQTDAYSYMNYLSRFYLHVGKSAGGPAAVNYPVTFKINRFFMAYEKNDIFAMSGKGSVLGRQIVEQGKSAQHAFTLYNSATQDREYYVNFISGSSRDTAIPDRGENKRFQVFIDQNNNKIKDDNEHQQILSMTKLKLKAGKDLHLVVVHTPDFYSRAKGGVLQRHNRKFQGGYIHFQEPKRLRSASYAVRTWLGTAEEVKTQETILAKLAYPSDDSDYKKYAKYNHRWNENPGLIRNSPDFKVAMKKAGFKK